MINEKEYAKVIAVNLRNIMYERHLTQADLARDLNINKATISSWMNATRTPKMANIDLLCDYFDVKRSAPQNAKYSVLRGFSMPAAGVEPALNDGVMPSNAKLSQVPFQNG